MVKSLINPLLKICPNSFQMLLFYILYIAMVSPSFTLKASSVMTGGAGGSIQLMPARKTW